MSDSDNGGAGTSGWITKKRKYGQHYKEEWEKLEDFKGFLVKSRKGADYAKCKACDKDINITSGKDDFIRKKCRPSPSSQHFQHLLRQNCQLKLNWKKVLNKVNFSATIFFSIYFITF